MSQAFEFRFTNNLDTQTKTGFPHFSKQIKIFKNPLFSNIKKVKCLIKSNYSRLKNLLPYTRLSQTFSLSTDVTSSS